MYQGLFNSLAICLSPFSKSLLLRVIWVCCDRQSAGTDQCNHQSNSVLRPYPASQVRSHLLTLIQSRSPVVPAVTYQVQDTDKAVSSFRTRPSFLLNLSQVRLFWAS